MKFELFFACMLITSALYSQTFQKVAGPDGALVVEIDCANGKLIYSIYNIEKPILENSPLGIVTNEGGTKIADNGEFPILIQPKGGFVITDHGVLLN